MATPRIDSLLEREEAMAVIHEVIASAGCREGSLALIQAVAGLGKTALLSAARELAASQGLRVVAALGAELERTFSFGVVRQLFERPLVQTPPGELRVLLSGPARLAAPIVGVPGDDLALPGAAEDLRGQRAPAVMHGLYWLASNLAERDPLAIIVDDAHLADVPSLRWLHYLARRLEGLPVAVLIAARPREPGAHWEALETIAAEPHVRAVPLAPLSPPAAAEVVRRSLGAGASDELCEACHYVSGGNPFLLRETIDALARDRVQPTVASVDRVRELVPDAVLRSVVLRLARLPEAAGGLAKAAAVLGSGAQLRDAAALAELDARAAARAADSLARAGILAPGLPLRFVHPLLHTAVLNDLPDAERALWHGRAGRIVAAGGGGADSVAAHLLRAPPQDDPWAVAQLRQTAEQAMARADPRSAIPLLRRAFVEPVPNEARIGLLGELLDAAFMAMDAGALEGLDADPGAEIAADAAALQRSATPVIISLYFTGRQAEALAVLERAVSAAVEEGDDGLALRLEARWITFAQLEPWEARRRFERFAGRVGSGTFASRLLDAGLAWYACFTGGSAADVGERARRAFGDGRLVVDLKDDDWVLGTYVMSLLLADELDLAERVIEQILELGRARGSASTVASGSFLKAYLARQRGELVVAEGDAQTAVRAFSEGGIVASLPSMTALLVDTLVERGRLDEAASELSAAVEEGEVPDLWWISPLLWSRAKLRLAQGRAREGVEDLLEMARRGDRINLRGALMYPWGSYAAPYLSQSGDRGQAQEIAEREVRDAAAWGTPRVIGRSLRGLGLMTPGLRGLDLLQDAVETLERSPARLEHAHALVDLGAALRRRNRRSEARAPLRTGLEMAHRCGAHPLAQRALHELRATGAKPRNLVLSGVESLTPSERRVADMAAEGRTNREIAQALFVTVKTIDTHMTHIFQKLDLRSRTELRPILATHGPARARIAS